MVLLHRLGAILSEDKRRGLCNISEQDRCEFALGSDGDRKLASLLGLLLVEQEILRVETCSQDRKVMGTVRGFAGHAFHTRLQVNKRAEMRLVFFRGNVDAGAREKHDVFDIGLIHSLDCQVGGLQFVMVRQRDNEGDVALLELLGRAAQIIDLAANDLTLIALQALARGRVDGDCDDRGDVVFGRL